MKRALLILAFLVIPQFALAGSQTYTVPETYNFTVPTCGSLTVQVWGGGGSGALSDNQGGNGSDIHTMGCFENILWQRPVYLNA